MEILFDFKGEINNVVLRSILKTLDDRMAESGEDRFVRKKINSILIECLQNLIFHAEKLEGPQADPSLQVAKNGDRYDIETANPVPDEKADTLRRYLDKINSMNEEELRDYYQEVLTNGRFNPQGGAGLGIINIARKTRDHKVRYAFEPFGEGHQLFRMMIAV